MISWFAKGGACKINYLTKSLSSLIGAAAATGKFKKPATCPICGIGTDAPVVQFDKLYFGENLFFSVSCKCTACNKHFAFSFEYIKDREPKDPMVYPQPTKQYENETLSSISPRFIDIMNQANRCEVNEDYDLAAVGYRLALECLVKDFAIYEKLGSDEDIKKASLMNAIEKYIGNSDLISTADVVRILGNDYAHYERKHPQHDFILLKKYMEIFISQIEVKILVAHPPVARK